MRIRHNSARDFASIAWSIFGDYPDVCRLSGPPAGPTSRCLGSTRVGSGFAGAARTCLKVEAAIAGVNVGRMNSAFFGLFLARFLILLQIDLRLWWEKDRLPLDFREWVC